MPSYRPELVRAVAQRRTPNRASPTGLKSSSTDPNTLWLFRFPMANGNGATVRRVHRPRNAPFDELSSREKRQVADELMLPTSFLRVVLMAAVLLLAFLLGPSSSLFEPVRSGAQYDARATSSLPENGG